MAIRSLRRQATNPLAAPGTPNTCPIYCDSDDNIVKMIPAGSGTTEVQLVDASSAQTLTNKTLTAPTITGATNSGTIASDVKVLVATATATSNVVAATLTGFSWTVVAGGTYVFEVDLPVTMTTNGGLTVNFKLTTATLTSIQYRSYAATASDNTTAVSTQGTTTTDATKVFDSATAAYTLLHLEGSFVVNAGGTFAWQFCQNTSHANTTSVLLGGFARLTRTL